MRKRSVDAAASSAAPASPAAAAAGAPSSLAPSGAPPASPSKHAQSPRSSKLNPVDPKTGKPKSRWRDLSVRTASTIVLIASFAIILYNGQWAAAGLVVALQILMFHEVMSLFYKQYAKTESNIRLFRSFQWYFLGCTLFFIYGRMAKNFLEIDLPKMEAFLSQYHSFLSFLLWVFGFVGFVMSLERKYARMQLTQFAWTHMTLLLVVAQSTFILANIFEGLIWFLLPASLIVANDIFAYLCGRAFGRTKLIGVSPNKTLEGFLGAAVITCVFAFFFSRYLASIGWMICPMTRLGQRFEVCDPHWVFLPRLYEVPTWLASLGAPYGLFANGTVELLPVQLHSLVYALFGSLIGPFGGFFASGVKRALKIDDFGASIPGHGGVTDRFDCQLIMGLFAYLYHDTFLKHSTKADYYILKLGSLDGDGQMRVYQALANMLTGKGLLP